MSYTRYCPYCDEMKEVAISIQEYNNGFSERLIVCLTCNRSYSMGDYKKRNDNKENISCPSMSTNAKNAEEPKKNEEQ